MQDLNSSAGEATVADVIPGTLICLGWCVILNQSACYHIQFLHICQAIDWAHSEGPAERYVTVH